MITIALPKHKPRKMPRPKKSKSGGHFRRNRPEEDTIVQARAEVEGEVQEETMEMVEKTHDEQSQFEDQDPMQVQVQTETKQQGLRDEPVREENEFVPLHSPGSTSASTPRRRKETTKKTSTPKRRKKQVIAYTFTAFVRIPCR